MFFGHRVFGRYKHAMFAVQGTVDGWKFRHEVLGKSTYAMQSMCKYKRYSLQHLQQEPASSKLLEICTNSICNYSLPCLLGGLLAVSDNMHNGSHVRDRHKFILEVL